MKAFINILYQSDYFRIRDFKCNCKKQGNSGKEYSKHFNISFVRKGNFMYRVFKKEFDAFTGYVIVDKPMCEYTVGHFHHVPDECTIIDFTDSFYDYLYKEQKLGSYTFFKENDIQSALIQTLPEIEYLHHLVLNQCRTNTKTSLLIDDLVFEILNWVIKNLKKDTNTPTVNYKLKKYHLQTIEKAKSYIIENYMNDISFKEIAEHVNVSPFHFSRLFKAFTNLSPHKFLVDTRLKKSELLVRRTDIPIFDIAIDSGFNSMEHFSAAFKQSFRLSPIHYRNKIR